MELREYSEFRNNETSDKFVTINDVNDVNDGCTELVDLKKITWAVFPKNDKIHPFVIYLDPMKVKLTLEALTYTQMDRLHLSNVSDIVNNPFDRELSFDLNNNNAYHVQGVDKIKLFSNLDDAREFVKCKTDADFVRRKGNYYVLSIREAQNLIGKTLNVSPRLVVIETN